MRPFQPNFPWYCSPGQQPRDPLSAIWLGSLLLFLAISTLASAQPDTPQAGQPAPAKLASLHGAVVGPDGAVYQGVQITLTGTNPPASVQSDSNGRYVFGDLPAGSYKLSFSGPGFATQVVPVRLDPGQSLEVKAVTLLVSTATTSVQVDGSQSQFEIAQYQLQQEEQQRIFGAIPNFYVVYYAHPAPLTPKQKFHLAWRSSIDPFTFLANGVFAGIEQAANTYPGYGQGARGYAKRYGAGYADGFTDTMIGSAILPSLLKQDPRYYWKGTGTTRSRILYALANSVVCKGDNGRWQFNYSGILGGAAAGGISNLYYPAADRNGIGLTVENTALGIAGSAVQNLFQEFLVRKLTPKANKPNPPQP